MSGGKIYNRIENIQPYQHSPQQIQFIAIMDKYLSASTIVKISSEINNVNIKSQIVKYINDIIVNLSNTRPKKKLNIDLDFIIDSIAIPKSYTSKIYHKYKYNKYLFKKKMNL